MSSTMTQNTFEDRMDAVEREFTSLSEDVNHNEQARKKLLGLSNRMLNLVETPNETIYRFVLQPQLNAAMRVAIDMGLLKALNQSAGPMTAAELAQQTGGDKVLIVRILRPLAAISVVHETGIDTYTPGALSKALDTPSLQGAAKFWTDESALACVNLPSFLASTSYNNPAGPKGNLQSTLNTDLQVWEWISTKNPESMASFYAMIGAWRANRPEWFEIYPVAERLFAGSKPHADDDSTIFLVDVAGGDGHDIHTFYQRFHSMIPGRLVLEDLDHAINLATEASASIIKVPYNFLDPQPIKGARVYYFRQICHDWWDQRCRALLRNTVEAMEVGYSRLLINEWVIPNTGSTLLAALLDIEMLAVTNGAERTESQWRELLGSVGLEIVKIWSVDKDTESLIECVRKA